MQASFYIKVLQTNCYKCTWSQSYTKDVCFKKNKKQKTPKKQQQKKNNPVAWTGQSPFCKSNLVSTNHITTTYTLCITAVTLERNTSFPEGRWLSVTKPRMCLCASLKEKVRYVGKSRHWKTWKQSTRDWKCSNRKLLPSFKSRCIICYQYHSVIKTSWYRTCTVFADWLLWQSHHPIERRRICESWDIGLYCINTNYCQRSSHRSQLADKLLQCFITIAKFYRV